MMSFDLDIGGLSAPNFVRLFYIILFCLCTYIMSRVCTLVASTSTKQNNDRSLSVNNKAHPAVVTAISRRHIGTSLLASGLSIAFARPSGAVGLESVPLPEITSPSFVEDWRKRNQGAIDEADQKFEESSLLKTLKERSEANRAQRQRELRDKYCMRESEWGVGDCSGLRLIPGATKSGVQKRPEWLEELAFGKSAEE